MIEKWESTFRVGIFKCHMTYSKRRHQMPVDANYAAS
jgi:hypothetical protein